MTDDDYNVNGDGGRDVFVDAHFQLTDFRPFAFFITASLMNCYWLAYYTGLKYKNGVYCLKHTLLEPRP